MSELLLFFSALVAVYLAPGPDMILVLSTTASEGVRRAIATAIGLALARATHVLLAAVGLAALFESQPWTYHTVRLAGAAYLFHLGWQFFRKTGELSARCTWAAANPRSRGYLSALYRGLTTNLLNPKSLIFCSVLLPQFIQPELAGIASQFAVLALILVMTGFAFDIGYALMGGGLWALTAENPSYQRVQNTIFAVLMMGIGLKVAVS